MPERQKLSCPRCGAEMNFHAEKLDHVRTLADPEAEDPDLGGVLVEFHTCPRCGFVRERAAR